MRKEDLFARYGGEEFALVMPETIGRDAVQVVEQIRRLVEKNPFDYVGHPYQVTISAGVTATNGEDWLAPSEMIRLADENLYQAKRQGRNRSGWLARLTNQPRAQSAGWRKPLLALGVGCANANNHFPAGFLSLSYWPPRLRK